MLILLLGQFHGFLEMFQIFTDFNGSLNVEEVTFNRGLGKETTQVINFLLLYVAIQEQSCVFLLR